MSFISNISCIYDFKIGKQPVNFLAEGFYTLLEDPFYTYTNNELSANIRDNSADNASVTGVNIELKSYVIKSLEAQLGITFQNSKYEKAQAWGDEEQSVSTEFMRTPDSYGYALFNWRPNKEFTASLSFDYTGKMKVPHMGLSQEEYNEALANGIINDGDVIVGEKLETSKSFITTDISVSYNFNILHNNQTKLQIYAGVKNIFNQFQDDYDKGVYRDAAYVYGPRQPRTINIGLKLGSF
jgi:outer membrane receptor for ferrienterochelin and colicins